MSLKPAVSKTDHVQGNEKALIELVEYGDYQCPHCGHAYPIVKKIQKALGEKLLFVFRNFPLQEIHPSALLAAVASEAAARQNKFWEMHDLIFENQNNLSEQNILALAKHLKLDSKKFEKDLEDEKLLDKVNADFESGVRSGVNGTPTFFINGVKYTGSWEYADLLAHLKSLI